MNQLIVWVLLTVSFTAQSQMSNEAERRRINSERAALEVGFSQESSACYQKFWVNNCLEEVSLRRRESLADLRRQEIVLNDQERKAKGAEAVKSLEAKDSPEKQQEAADRRTQALKDSDERMAREQQKNAGRVTSEATGKTKVAEASSRISNAHSKQAGRAVKKKGVSEEIKKYTRRLEKAQERQARLANEKASQTKAPAAPLPLPN